MRAKALRRGQKEIGEEKTERRVKKGPLACPW